MMFGNILSDSDDSEAVTRSATSPSRVEPDHWHRFHPGRRHFANFPALFQSIFASNCIAVSFVVAVINAVRLARSTSCPLLSIRKSDFLISYSHE